MPPPVLLAVGSGLGGVEREGLSLEHPYSLALIASYNPEEGPLGPQLSDCFGLCVQVNGEADPALRLEVPRHRLSQGSRACFVVIIFLFTFYCYKC